MIRHSILPLCFFSPVKKKRVSKTYCSRCLLGLNKIVYVQVPKAAFGTLEGSLNASSLALSPWLCVFEKRQERQAWQKAFFMKPA